MSKNNVLTKLNLVIAVCVAMMLLISCGKGGATSGKKIKVTTTTTMLSDLVKTIGGDKVEVTGLMGEGVDPHLYSASAGDIEKLGNADIIVYGGLHLEGKMTEIFEKLTSQNKNILNVGDKLDKSKIHLVDQLGGLNEAVAKAAQLAKLSNYSTNNYPAKASWFDMFKEEGGRNSYIDEQLRLTLGDLYEPLAMVRVAKQRQMMQAQLPYVLNIK